MFTTRSAARPRAYQYVRPRREAVALLGQLVRPTAAVRVALFGGDGDCELQTGARLIGCTQLSESTAVLYRYDRSSRQALRRFHYETPTCDDGSPSRSSPMSFTRCTPTEDGLSEQLIEDDNHTAAASSGDLRCRLRSTRFIEFVFFCFFLFFFVFFCFFFVFLVSELFRFV